jgi:t-SNARE complex subunit (syntaxin)
MLIGIVTMSPIISYLILFILQVQGLRDLIKLAEKGKFTDMKNKLGEAVSDYQIIESTYKKKVISH